MLYAVTTMLTRVIVAPWFDRPSRERVSEHAVGQCRIPLLADSGEVDQVHPQQVLLQPETQFGCVLRVDPLRGPACYSQYEVPVVVGIAVAQGGPALEEGVGLVQGVEQTQPGSAALVGQVVALVGDDVRTQRV